MKKTYIDIAKSIVEAEDRAKPISKISESYPEFTIEDAYKIQEEVFNIKTQRGERIIGKKIGLTSEGIRKQIGVFEPDFSFITDKNYLHPYENLILSDMINPKLEPELAFLINKDLKEKVITNWDVMSAIEGVLPAFEVVDTRYRNYDFTIVDTISDSASYGRIIVGNKMTNIQNLEMEEIALSVFKDGKLIKSASSSEVMGNPINAVTWLANKMVQLGNFIKKGDIILSGSFTPVLDIEAGETYEAVFSNVGSVKIKIDEWENEKK